MRIMYQNLARLLLTVAILGCLVAIAQMPASAAASFMLSPNAGPVCQAVTIAATGYSTSSVLTARFDGVPVATSPATVIVTADPTVFAIIIPTTTAGPHQITVLQDGINPLTQSFTVQPKVVVTVPSSKQGPVGTSVTVAGRGFSGVGVTADVTMSGHILVTGCLWMTREASLAPV